MRVLMVSDVYFPRVNGVSSSIETFRHALKAHGVEVDLVVPRYGHEACEDGVLRVEGRAVPGDPEDRLLPWRVTQRAVLAAARRCDVIHIQTPFVAHYAGQHAARQLGLPVLTTYHTLFEEYLQHYIPFLPARCLRFGVRAFSRHQCNAMDGVIVPSNAMQQRLAAYGVQAPVHVVPTGVPLNMFASGNRAGFRRRHGIAEERAVALFVGRVAHEKNIDFLLDAWALALARQPQLLLLVAGDGPALPSLKARVHALGMDHAVIFLGYLDRKLELPDCYAAADVFVFSSRTETQGLVLLEAMATGLPVIALSEMGTADILRTGQGCLVPAASEEAFAGAILEYFNAPALRERLKTEALAAASAWSEDACAKRLAMLYRTLVLQAGTTRQAPLALRAD